MRFMRPGARTAREVLSCEQERCFLVISSHPSNPDRQNTLKTWVQPDHPPRILMLERRSRTLWKLTQAKPTTLPKPTYSSASVHDVRGPCQGNQTNSTALTTVSGCSSNARSAVRASVTRMGGIARRADSSSRAWSSEEQIELSRNHRIKGGLHEPSHT
jgi:hypothetical protein